jgi:hypothetical protein
MRRVLESFGGGSGLGLLALAIERLFCCRKSPQTMSSTTAPRFFRLGSSSPFLGRTLVFDVVDLQGHSVGYSFILFVFANNTPFFAFLSWTSTYS